MYRELIAKFNEDVSCKYQPWFPALVTLLVSAAVAAGEDSTEESAVVEVEAVGAAEGLGVAVTLPVLQASAAK